MRQSARSLMLVTGTANFRSYHRHKYRAYSRAKLVSQMSLFEKYKHATQVIVGVMSTIFVYIMTIVYPAVIKKPSSDTAEILFILGLGSIYSIFYIVCMWFYENFAWKLIHIRDNYSGYWDMYVTYEFLERSGRYCQAELDLPFTFHSAFKIEQSATTLRFPEGYSAPNEIWKDRATRLTADGIDMSYEVTRSDKSLSDALPPQSFGFEIVRVTEFGRLGRPAAMAGTMFHAALPDISLYRGHTQYRRVSAKRYATLLRELPEDES